MKHAMKHALYLAAFLLFLVVPPTRADVPGLMGSGAGQPEEDIYYKALNAAGVKVFRIGHYPWTYYDQNTKMPTPQNWDKALWKARQYGITPYLFFEVENPDDPNNPLWDYDQWFRIGRAHAERFRPNSAWWKQQGVTNYGVMTYCAFNEPDIGPIVKSADKIAKYARCLEGLADGVHSVSPKLRVLPGGFATPNSNSDWTMRGIGLALAPLFNNGKLDGVDVHSYLGGRFAPLDSTRHHSSQNYFDQIKRACGITADINFYTTEFNCARYAPEGITEEFAYPRLLLAIWDALGVVKNDGRTSATRIAMPYSLFLDIDKDSNGFRTALDPWTPHTNGKIVRMVATKTAGMSFASLDPKKSGVFVLKGKGKKMWVWQNWKGWTDRPGTSFTLTGIPRRATRLEVYGWDSYDRPRQTLPLSG